MFRQGHLRLFITDVNSLVVKRRWILLGLLTRLRLAFVKTSIPISQNFGNSRRVRRNSPAVVDSHTFIYEHRERIVRERGAAYRPYFRPETTII